MNSRWPIVVLLCLLAPAAGRATILDPVTTDQLAEKATLIFEGTAIRVEYRNSDVESREDVALPHTFVTFRIDRLLKGASQDGGEITLRFQGGPDGEGNTMMIPGIPLFDVGEEVVLFVRGNGTEMCPVVGWEQGRFRLVDDAVLTEQGEEIWMDSKGRMLIGPYKPAPEVVMNRIGDSIVEFETVDASPALSMPKDARRMDVASFRSYVSTLIARAGRTAGVRVPGIEKSARLADRFHPPNIRAAGPPVTP